MNFSSSPNMATRAASVSFLLFTLLLTACERSTQKVAPEKPEAQGSAASVSSTTEPLGVATPSLWPKLNSPIPVDTELEGKIDKLLAQMSVEEKVGQIVQAEINKVKPGDVKKYHLGAILNGGTSKPYHKKNPTTADWVQLYDAFYEESMDESDGKVAIPIIWGTDAVHGHNNAIGSTIFPHNIGLGAAHDPELMRKIGEDTAQEVRATAIDWVFAPTLAVARDDAWGRTYESYSEAPAIVAQYAGEFVKGLQGEVTDKDFLKAPHVVATAKHFLGDGGTWKGDDQGDAKISEQELINIHNAGYPPALEAGVQTVMISFSSWNGVKNHGNKSLITGVLKQQMGFDGFVVSDWSGHSQIPGCTEESCAQAINAGIDMVMEPSSWKGLIRNTIEQVKSGEIAMARLNDAVRRILRVKIRANLWAAKPSERKGGSSDKTLGSAEHRALARQAVRESLVLLKNQAKILPLNPAQNVLVAGTHANHISLQSGGWSLTWQGTDTTNAQFPGSTTIYQGIADAVVAAGGHVTLSAEAEYSQKPDVAIVVFGEQPYAEGLGDRDTLEFEPGDKQSLALLKKLRADGIPVVSVFISGRPMWVNPEINQSNAFVAAWLPGTEGAGIADLLFTHQGGAINYDFTGKLSFSWPKLPLNMPLNVNSENYDPLFAYGYGLNYQSNDQGPLALAENVEGLVSEKSDDIDLYVGRLKQPWNLFLLEKGNKQIFSGNYAALAEGDIKLETADKNVQEDALRFSWNNATDTRLEIVDGQPLNLQPYMVSGAIQFDIKVHSMSKGDLGLAIGCGNNCTRRAALQLPAAENQGWTSISLGMSCFKRDGDNFTAVARPFTLDAKGSGDIEFANIRFLMQADAKTECIKLN